MLYNLYSILIYSFLIQTSHTFSPNPDSHLKMVNGIRIEYSYAHESDSTNSPPLEGLGEVGMLFIHQKLVL